MSQQSAYDPDRLRRAARRPIRRTANPRQAFVASGSKPKHWWPVDLDAEQRCYCPDAQYRGGPCVHELAARLASGDLTLLQALGNMLQEAENNLKAYTRRTRRQPPPPPPPPAAHDPTFRLKT